MKVFIGVPHDINVFDKNCVTFLANDRKWVLSDATASAAFTYPSNGMLNAQFQTEEVEDDFPFPVSEEVVKSVDSMPDGYDKVVVSARYLNAARAVGVSTVLYTVDNPVYEIGDDGRPGKVVGCLGLKRNT